MIIFHNKSVWNPQIMYFFKMKLEANTHVFFIFTTNAQNAFLERPFFRKESMYCFLECSWGLLNEPQIGN